jgi:hypothetical protein
MMLSHEKHLLKASLTPSVRQRFAFTAQQKAAINIDNATVPSDDHGGPYAVQRANVYTAPDGTTAISLQSRPEDRWYAVYKAVGFTGIARSSDRFRHYVMNGVSDARGKKAHSREEAKLLWLTEFYKGETRTL